MKGGIALQRRRVVAISRRMAGSQLCQRQGRDLVPDTGDRKTFSINGTSSSAMGGGARRKIRSIAVWASPQFDVLATALRSAAARSQSGTLMSTACQGLRRLLTARESGADISRLIVGAQRRAARSRQRAAGSNLEFHLVDSQSREQVITGKRAPSSTSRSTTTTRRRAVRSS